MTEPSAKNTESYSGSEVPMAEPALRPAWANRTFSFLIELWIAAILVVFFVIRVLGSQMAHRILSRL